MSVLWENFGTAWLIWPGTQQCMEGEVKGQQDNGVTRTRLLVVDWTVAASMSRRLACFTEIQNLVSAHVPSNPNCTILNYSNVLSLKTSSVELPGGGFTVCINLVSEGNEDLCGINTRQQFCLCNKEVLIYLKRRLWKEFKNMWTSKSTPSNFRIFHSLQ
jgi:hypothetical protein